jgi:hypothetical protein
LSSSESLAGRSQCSKRAFHSPRVRILIALARTLMHRHDNRFGIGLWPCPKRWTRPVRRSCRRARYRGCGEHRHLVHARNTPDHFCVADRGSAQDRFCMGADATVASHFRRAMYPRPHPAPVPPKSSRTSEVCDPASRRALQPEIAASTPSRSMGPSGPTTSSFATPCGSPPPPFRIADA